jgi:trigger factor
MRRAVAEWVEVDRVAAQGDLIEGDLLELTTEETASAEPHQVRFEVGDAQVWEELTSEAVGKKKSQSGEFDRKVGEDEEQEIRSYRLTISSVKERDLPDLDADLAAKLGEFDSVEALENDVEQRIRQSKQAELRQKREQALLDQLRERHPVELPQGVVDYEIEGMLRDYAQNLSSSGVDLEQQNVDWQALGEQVRPQAESRVHARLLLDAVAAGRQLEVDEEDFERTLASIASVQRKETGAVRQELDRAGRLGELRSQMRREKALRSLLGEDEDTSTPTEDQPEE